MWPGKRCVFHSCGRRVADLHGRGDVLTAVGTNNGVKLLNFPNKSCFNTGL